LWRRIVANFRLQEEKSLAMSRLVVLFSTSSKYSSARW